MAPLLTINDLHVSFETHAGKVQAVRGINLSVKEGETLAIVGESGSGKSVTSKAIMGLLPKSSALIEKGEIWFKDSNLLTLRKKEMQKLRGSEIAIIFQDPMTALNPTMKIGKQITEGALRHQHLSKKEAQLLAIELLELVGIPHPQARLHQYPHEFSGGMRQRVVIALALACKPKLLIADEPTTALDVTIQAQILDLLKDIQEKTGTSIIFITHDLGVVANVADSVAVMYAGRIVEKGSVNDIFYRPTHPYNWGLLQSMPNMETETKGELYSIPGSPPDLSKPVKGDAFAPRNEFALAIDYEKEPPNFQISETHYASTWLLHPQAPKIVFDKQTTEEIYSEKSLCHYTDEVLLTVKNLKKHFPLPSSKEVLKAVDGISLEIKKGETFGLVGESGCGKSTTGRTILGLYESTAGDVLYDGEQIKTKNKKKFSRKIQMIFQDPYASLDPRKKVEDIIAEGMDIHKLYNTEKERREKVESLLEEVGLQADHASRYSHEFSGGQRQRIGIARALAVEPELIIADEPISALDVSIQAQVVNLLKKLQREKGITFLFIAHDLSMVKYISDRIGVMYLGKMVELADAEKLYKNPLHPYTRSLLSSVPVPDPDIEKERKRIVLEGELPSPVNPPQGCRFRTRCPLANKKCMETPEWREVEEGHWVSCHFA